MSYCRHENTARDLHDVLEKWNDDDDFSDAERRGRLSILRMALKLVKALEDEDMLNIDGTLHDEAEYVYV
jgi:hypothetical protein